ncbi:site-specific integrase [Corynebacterium amycolatum]|uniref:tyrosine-type recombinase/integrase n=1 Tax=Corynebacterium amycolatum TaxID=43765 RepID=UPI002AAC8612|nr:site-specific integrase [Corynebacterium amycolatum]MDY7341348.1 site-specific integrase [Corynebacterium amycolatum]
MAVQKRVRNGKTRWVARYRDPAGKEHSRTFETRREATLFLAEQEHAIHAGTWVNPTTAATTIGALAAGWEQQARPGGTRNARRALRRNLGALEHMPADKLPTPLVRQWVGQLRDGRPWIVGDEGLGVASVASLLQQLKAMLNQAVADQVIVRNPAARVQAPRPRTAVTWADIPTADEVRLLEGTAMEGVTGARRRALAEHGGKQMERYRSIHPNPDLAVAIRLGAATGMRAGELCGLTWDAVDLDSGRVSVWRQAETGGGLRELKTGETGHRTVTVDPATVEVLEAHRRHRPFSQRVVCRADGSPATPQWLGAQIARLRSALGLRDALNVKSLRHFHATSLLRAGVPVKTVQARLGHSTAVMTLQVYAHFVPDDDARAADAIGGVLAGAGQLRDGAGKLRSVE